MASRNAPRGSTDTTSTISYGNSVSLIDVGSRDTLQRKTRSRPIPILQQLRSVPSSPLAHHAIGTRRQRSMQNTTSRDGNQRPIALIGGVKMRRRMFRKEHSDGDAEK